MITISDQEYLDLLWYIEAYQELHDACVLADIDQDILNVRLHGALWAQKPFKHETIDIGKNEFGSNKV